VPKDNVFPLTKSLFLRGELIALNRPFILGILNLTEDSFYAGSRVKGEALEQRVRQMLENGVDILDIGAASSRPGAKPVSQEEELNRLLPALEIIRKMNPDIPVSIDTFHASVAEKCLDAGADLINDISGGTLDPEMAGVLVRHKCPYILMHMRGTPETMQGLTDYHDIVGELIRYFSSKIEELHRLGIHDIIIDPGIGFAKTAEQNFELLERLNELHILGKPILIGVSRKSMIYKSLGISAEEALPGTDALHALSLLKQARFLRVHDVKEARQIADLFHHFSAK